MTIFRLTDMVNMEKNGYDMCAFKAFKSNTLSAMKDRARKVFWYGGKQGKGNEHS